MWYDVKEVDGDGCKSFFVFKRAYLHLKSGFRLLVPVGPGKSEEQVLQCRRLVLAHIWYAHYVAQGQPANFFTLYEQMTAESSLPDGFGLLVVTSKRLVWQGMRIRSVMWVLLPAFWQDSSRGFRGAVRLQERVLGALEAIKLAGPVHGPVYSLMGFALDGVLSQSSTPVTVQQDTDGYRALIKVGNLDETPVLLFSYTPDYDAVFELVG